MLLAFDDTDGPGGGCTTWLAGELIEALGPEALSAPPRLVRLDPLVPWKTRGNAAVVLPLTEALDPEGVLGQATPVITRHARVAEGKGAGIVCFERPPDPSWYWRGVREELTFEEIEPALHGVEYETIGTGRGLIGALCAAAWRPSEQATWEHIAYRAPARWGTPREVPVEDLEAVEERYPGTFDCVDPLSGHAAMVPRTPCPVLYGLRATRPERLAKACQGIGGEPVDRATTFLTNQASDDHIDPDRLEPVIASAKPEALRGGHVRLPALTPSGAEVTCMAFEPTGRLRHAVLAIQPGDQLLPIGSWRGDQVNLEKLLHLPSSSTVPDTCPGCGVARSSAGRRAGRRCPRCGSRAPGELEQAAPRWAEADVSARRHVARPLRLGLAPTIQKAVSRLDTPVLGPMASPR